MTALYKIANEYAALENEDLDPEMIADTLEGIEGEFSAKLEQLLSIVKNQNALAAMLKGEAESMSERAKSCKAKAESIKQYIIKSLQTMDKTKMNAGLHTVTVRKPSKSVNIIDIDSLPTEFVKYETLVKADKNLIAEKLKLGQTIEGAELVSGKPSLIIK